MGARMKCGVLGWIVYLPPKRFELLSLTSNLQVKVKYLHHVTSKAVQCKIQGHCLPPIRTQPNVDCNSFA